MRSPGVAVAVLALAVNAAGAQAPSPITREMLAMETTLLARVGPQTQTWIKQEAARRQTATSIVTISTSVLTAATGLSALTSTEINAIKYLILMQRTKSIEAEIDELREKLRELQQDAKAKEEALERMRRLKELVAEHDKATAALAAILKAIGQASAVAIRNIR